MGQVPDPSFPEHGPLATPNLPEVQPIEYAQAGPLMVYRSSGLRTAEADGFRGPIFATPLPPVPRQVVVPSGGPLVAPVITANGMKHGRQLYDVIPAGDRFDPITTRHPEEFVFGPECCDLPQLTIWGSAEVLVGMTRGVDVPPLVTTGPAAQGVFVAGVLGQPGTTPLFGGRRMLNDWRAGMRAEAGAYFGDSQRWGASARLYSLFSTSEQLVGSGDGTNVVNLPQFISVGGTTIQFPIYVGFPGATIGLVSTTAQTTFTGGDLSLRRVIGSGGRARLELLAGYRQLHLGDELGAQFTVVGTGAGAGLSLIGEDSVRTRNNFYGPQLGSVVSLGFGRWTVEGLSAVALGVTASDRDFSRTRLLAVGGGTPVPVVQTVDPGGRVNYFGVVTETGVKLGFQVTEHARLTISYTGIYWTNVRRAQEQYNLSPTLTGGTTTFYTHALGWGAELRY